MGRVVHKASLDVSWSTEEAERHLGRDPGVVVEKNYKETVNASSKLIYLLTPAFFYVWVASPQTGVSTGRDGQSYQVSSTHLNPLLSVSRALCGLQHHQQDHQAFSRRHSGIGRRSSAGEKEREPGLAELNTRRFI